MAGGAGPTHRSATRWLPVLLLAASAPAFAAGVECARAASASERAICADPATRALDARMAERWRRALALSADLPALKADQRRWLAARDRCGAALACLRRHYATRIAELAPGAVGGRFDWRGRWARIGGSGDDASLTLTPDPSGYVLSLEAAAGGNTGDLQGAARSVRDTLVLAGGDSGDRDCRLVLRRVHRQIELEQSASACGAGLGVGYGGRYVPQAEGHPAEAPDWSLVNLGVLATPADEAALRGLLGAGDYAALLARTDLQTELADRDGFGARATDFSVHGLAASNRALLMADRSGHFWIALLDFDAAGHSEIRYYSNVPHWQARLPRTVAAWIATLDDHIPVRLRSRPHGETR